MDSSITGHSDSTHQWDGSDKIAMSSIQQAHKDVQSLLRTGVGVRKKFSALRMQSQTQDDARFRADCLHLTTQAILAVDKKIQVAAASTMRALDGLDAQITATHGKVCSVEALTQIVSRRREVDKRAAATMPASPSAAEVPERVEAPESIPPGVSAAAISPESPARTESQVERTPLEGALSVSFESADVMPSIESIRLGISLLEFPAISPPVSQMPVPPQPTGPSLSPLRDLPESHSSPLSPTPIVKRRLPPPLTAGPPVCANREPLLVPPMSLPCWH